MVAPQWPRCTLASCRCSPVVTKAPPTPPPHNPVADTSASDYRLRHVAGDVDVNSLGSGDGGACAERSRTFPRVGVATLALSHARGMASVATKGRRIVLLDVEEGEGEEDDGGEEEADGEGEGGAQGSEGAEEEADDAMEEED